jgi:hypothetical protein
VTVERVSPDGMTTYRTAPPPRVGTEISRGQCAVGIMAAVPGDTNPEPAAHYCLQGAGSRPAGPHDVHYCGCGYSWRLPTRAEGT